MKTISTLYLLVSCFLFPVFANAQLVLVTGKVINEKTGSVIENAGILESNSGIGTITNPNGFFSLMLNKGDAEIIVSYNGFNNFTSRLNLKSDTTVNVSLIPEVNIKSKQKDSAHQKTAGKLEVRKNK